MDVDVDATLESEELTEVPVSDDVPFDDDESSQYTTEDEKQDLIGEDTEPVVDMALCSFTGHSDSVYKAVVNPKFPGLVISGRSKTFSKSFHSALGQLYE